MVSTEHYALDVSDKRLVHDTWVQRVRRTSPIDGVDNVSCIAAARTGKGFVCTFR